MDQDFDKELTNKGVLNDKSISNPFPFPEEDELCQRLDHFYSTSGVRLDVPASEIFRGALRVICKNNSSNNPDWMSQSAHSLREVLYQFFKENKKLNETFEQYGSTYDQKKRAEIVGRYYNLVTNIAHHNLTEASKSSLIGGSKQNPIVITETIFGELVLQFGKVLYEVLRRQLDAHNEIDRMLSSALDSVQIDNVRRLLNLNPDARQYFFTKSDGKWLNWLWENGFLDVIKEKSSDPTRYGYRTPELNYLVRMAETMPKDVVDIMLSVDTSKNNFNPEVIDQFLRICGSLPADELARMVDKIRMDNWVQSMSVFNEWGFEYEKMFEALKTNNDGNSLLTLADAVLAVKSKEDYKKNANGYLLDNPFYFKDLSYTKVFEHLADIEGKNVVEALKSVCAKLTETVKLAETDDDGIFEYEDIFHLYDTDLFTLNLNQRRHLSDRENAKDLIACAKTLSERAFGENCDNAEHINEQFEKIILQIPENQSIWKLKLFVLSLCPTAFGEKLKIAFSRLFGVMKSGKHYHEIESGTEYKKALKKSFGSMSIDYQHQYVANVFEYFGKPNEDKQVESWYKRDGWQILSSVCEYLTTDEKKKCETVFGKKCDDKFEPETSIGHMRGGTVVPKGAISQDEFGNLEIPIIVEKLKNEWQPAILAKQNSHEDFLNPLNAEGVGSQLRTDIAKRLADYVANSKLFFQRDALDEHYSYSFFRGVQEAIRGNKSQIDAVEWGELIDTIVLIANSGKSTAFDSQKRDRETYDAWLANWTGVLSTVSDVLQELLNEKQGQILLDFTKHRDKLLNIHEFLLSYPDPEPKDEELETAKSKTRLAGEKEEYSVTDPFTMAINSVRGRAFQSFVLFVYQDGKKFAKTDKIKIDEDVKALYKKVLKAENTRAIMFMFGHYIASFYFRDRDWICDLLPQIFPQESEKRHLYLASWEGYLANNLYEEIFLDKDFQALYERGLSLTGTEDKVRRHFKEPDEGLAVHLALAFMFYCPRFGFDDSLFKKFWEKGKNVERQAEFISFIGRMFVSGDNAQANELLAKNEQCRQRLAEFWDWTLNNHDAPELFSDFGFWINLSKNIFDSAWLAERVKKTLKKTTGFLEWDYALVKSIAELAKASPRDTIEIVRLHLLEGGIRGKKIRLPFMYDDEWVEALKILYANAETKNDTYSLIDSLVRKGGSTFWKFKDVIK